MKKLVLGCMSLLFTTAITAQTECLNFLPSEEGTMLINTTYDGNDRLIGNSIYRINRYYNLGQQLNIDVTLTLFDAMDNVIGRGNINAHCDNDVFRMRMTNSSVSKAMLDRMAGHTEIVTNFMDYPNAFSNNSPLYNPTNNTTEDIRFTITSQEDSSDNLDVRIYNRQYEDSEVIVTPAGGFDTSKITFNFDVKRGNETKTYKGVDWYSLGKGVVRSETYDDNNNLLNYTVLTTVRNEQTAEND